MNTPQLFSRFLFGVAVLSAPMLHASTVNPFASFAFSSGGTGADGALALTASECPSEATEVTLDVGATGIKNYTSVSIHANCLVKFTPVGSGSAPVRWIVQGDVVIDGQLNLDGFPGGTGTTTTQSVGGWGGPGGYDGGKGAVPGSSRVGFAGFGPGGGRGGRGGTGTGGSLRPMESNPADQPLAGGSGGGGGGRSSDYNTSGSGGGGAGALMIASSGTITLSGMLSLQGGAGGSATYPGGGGSGGTVHLIANTINGEGTVNATYIILETLQYRGNYTSSGALNVISFQQLALGQAGPTLAISSVGGNVVVAGEGLVLGSAGETQVTVTSTHLDAGTQVTLLANGAANVASTVTVTLDAQGTGTGTLTIPSGVSLISAYVSGFVEQTTSLQPYQGERIVTARLAAGLGEASSMTFYTESGREVPSEVAQAWQLARHVRFGSN